MLFLLLFLAIFIFIFKWNIVGIQHYVISLWNEDHNKSVPIQSYHHMTGHIPYALWDIPMAYLFCNWRFIPLNFLHLFCPSLSNHSFVLWVYDSVFLFYFIFLDSTYKWVHTIYILFCLISLSIMPSSSMHIVHCLCLDICLILFFFESL